MNADLDELKALWSERDRKLDTLIDLNRDLLAGIQRKPARTAIGWLTLSLIGEALVALPAILLLGNFLAGTIGSLRFALPAAFLDVLSIATLAVVIRQIVIVREIDYAGPIAAIQTKLEQLRVLRIRFTQTLLALLLLIWPPLAIVGLKGLLGIDAYAVIGPAYLWANVLLGLAVIPIAVWIARRIEARAGSSSMNSALIRAISGSSLTAATQRMAAIAAFERDAA